MRATLRPHPDFPGPEIEIESEAERSGSQLRVSFRLTGDIAGVRVPPDAPFGRVDELWRHTCFEAFLAPPGVEAYCEINLSPSGQWATYEFTGYRAGMRPAPVLPASSILWGRDLVLLASMDLGAISDLAAAPWRLGLSAVIEALDGSLSYWAVAHPPGRPDFHHADCFALEVPAPQGS